MPFWEESRWSCKLSSILLFLPSPSATAATDVFASLAMSSTPTAPTSPKMYSAKNSPNSTKPTKTQSPASAFEHNMVVARARALRSSMTRMRPWRSLSRIIGRSDMGWPLKLRRRADNSVRIMICRKCTYLLSSGINVALLQASNARIEPRLSEGRRRRRERRRTRRRSRASSAAYGNEKWCIWKLRQWNCIAPRCSSIKWRLGNERIFEISFQDIFGSLRYMTRLCEPFEYWHGNDIVAFLLLSIMELNANTPSQRRLFPRMHKTCLARSNDIIMYIKAYPDQPKNWNIWINNPCILLY